MAKLVLSPTRLSFPFTMHVKMGEFRIPEIRRRNSSMELAELMDQVKSNARIMKETSDACCKRFLSGKYQPELQKSYSVLITLIKLHTREI